MSNKARCRSAEHSNRTCDGENIIGPIFACSQRVEGERGDVEEWHPEGDELEEQRQTEEGEGGILVGAGIEELSRRPGGLSCGFGI